MRDMVTLLIYFLCFKCVSVFSSLGKYTCLRSMSLAFSEHIPVLIFYVIECYVMLEFSNEI